MPLSAGRLLQRLRASGILDEGELASLSESISSADSSSPARPWGEQLVAEGRLTRYQLDAILNDRGAELSLGNYLVEEELGRGGMGVVLEARHRRMNRHVAVKVLPPHFCQQPDAVARFHREIQALARLSHPNVVVAHDADEDGGRHFLVMELVRGTTLAELVRERGPLPVAQAVDVLRQAALGLDYAHRNGVVHRDLKPSNLLVDLEGRVKVLDLGLARLAVENPDEQRDLTATGLLVGTVDYMAPEQALDPRQADNRSDVYSLGCTLYFLVHGRPPFAGTTVMERLLAHREAPVPSLGRARPDVPRELDALFQRMLAKRPRDRVPSAAEVANALERIGVTAGPPLTVDPHASTIVPDDLVAAYEPPPESATATVATPVSHDTRDSHDTRAEAHATDNASPGTTLPPRAARFRPTGWRAWLALVVALIALRYAVATAWELYARWSTPRPDAPHNAAPAVTPAPRHGRPQGPGEG